MRPLKPSPFRSYPVRTKQPGLLSEAVCKQTRIFSQEPSATSDPNQRWVYRGIEQLMAPAMVRIRSNARLTLSQSETQKYDSITALLLEATAPMSSLELQIHYCVGELGAALLSHLLSVA